MTPDNKEKDNRNKTEMPVAEKNDWSFYSLIRKPSGEELTDAEGYKFGSLAGCLYNQFMEVYVVREEVVPGDPMRRTVIRKPSIYNSVRAVEKQISKDMKSEKLSQEQASDEFCKVLKTALSAIDSESAAFEDVLQDNRKDVDQLRVIFADVQLTDI